MATVITSECINCGACEPECPNTAIYQGGVEWELNGTKHPAIATEIFYIVPDKCTECVGFFDHEACAAVCPVDCCIPDPNNAESEQVLIERAKQLHPDEAFGDDFPSRFRKEGAAPPPAAPESPKTPAEPAAPAAAPPPAAAAAPATPAPAAAEPARSPAQPAAGAPPPAAAATAAAKPAAVPPTPAAAAAKPSSAAAAQPETSLSIPEVEEWEIPIECFRCHGTYAIAFKHFRSGVVLYCPFCQGSYVVNSSMHNGVARSLRTFHARWRQQFERFQAQRKQELHDFEERQHVELEAFNESLRNASREFHPAGAPRKRAWIFG